METNNSTTRTAIARQIALNNIDNGIEVLRSLPGAEAALATLEAHRANVAAGGAFTPPPVRKWTAAESREANWQDGPSLFFR